MRPLSGANRKPEVAARNTARRSSSLPRTERIQRSADFKRAYQQRKRWVGQFMVLWRATTHEAQLRVGIVTSKKVGGAVQRNRARRKLREAWRQNKARFKGHYDIVLVARRKCVNAKPEEIENELRALAHKAGLQPQKDVE